jgi:hypothetical protein
LLSRPSTPVKASRSSTDDIRISPAEVAIYKFSEDGKKPRYQASFAVEEEEEDTTFVMC